MVLYNDDLGCDVLIGTDDWWWWWCWWSRWIDKYNTFNIVHIAIAYRIIIVVNNTNLFINICWTHTHNGGTVMNSFNLLQRICFFLFSSYNANSSILSSFLTNSLQSFINFSTAVYEEIIYKPYLMMTFKALLITHFVFF